MYGYRPLEVKVWGMYACFTRPETRIERVSYEVPTPSAARGILEAIFWHPPMEWRVREIVILKPIEHFSILRNEVTEVISEKNKSGWLDITDNRSQRHTLALREVEYIIRADVHLPPGSTDADPAKYRDQFQRRVRQGKCFSRPFLGCREFAADFELPTGEEKPIDITTDLGLMLFDVFYRAGDKLSKPKQKEISYYHHLPDKRILIKGYAEAQFKPFRLERGVMRVPNEYYEEATKS